MFHRNILRVALSIYNHLRSVGTLCAKFCRGIELYNQDVYISWKDFAGYHYSFEKLNSSFFGSPFSFPDTAAYNVALPLRW